jgi:hypothetical protein
MKKKIVPELFRNDIFKDYLKLTPYGFTKNTNSILFFQDYELKRHINKFFKNIKFHVIDVQIIRNKDILNINILYLKNKYKSTNFNLTLFSKLNFYKFLYLKNLLNFSKENKYIKFKKLFKLPSGKKKYYTIRKFFFVNKLFFKFKKVFRTKLFNLRLEKMKTINKSNQPFNKAIILNRPDTIKNDPLFQLTKPIRYQYDDKFWTKFNRLNTLYYLNRFRNRFRVTNYAFKIKNEPYPMLKIFNEQKKEKEKEIYVQDLKDRINEQYSKSKALRKTGSLESLIQRVNKRYKKKKDQNNDLNIIKPNYIFQKNFKGTLSYYFLKKRKFFKIDWLEGKENLTLKDKERNNKYVNRISKKVLKYKMKNKEKKKKFFDYEFFIYQLNNLNYIYKDYLDYYPIYTNKFKSKIFYKIKDIKIQKPLLIKNFKSLNITKKILLAFSKYVLKKRNFKYKLIYKIIKFFLLKKKDIKLNFYLILYVNFCNLQIYIYYKYLIYKLKTRWTGLN